MIITSGTLPVPAVNGGAVENLTQVILDLNEIHCDFKICVFTIGKKDLNKGLISGYKHSEFIIFNEKSIFYQIQKLIRFLLNRFAFINIPNQFIHSVLQHDPIINKADLILISNNPDYSSHINKHYKIPLILHLHNDYINISKGNQELLKNIKKIICVSDYISNEINKVCPKNCAISRVYNGIDINKFSQNIDPELKNKLMRYHNLEEDDMVFIFTGRIQESKGVKLLVESFLELLKYHSKIKLMIVGGSEFKGSKENKLISFLKNLISSNQASNNIFFTGYVDYNELHSYYKLAQVAIIPSLETEAFGLTCIEAQAAGLPVIITDSGGLTETISKESGFIIERNKKIKTELKRVVTRLIEDEELILKMSKAAKRNAKRFDANFYYNNLCKEIKEV